MYSSELMSINETVTCPFLTSCNVSLDLERETKNIGARRVGLLYLTSVSHIILTLLRALRALAKSSIIFRTQKFRYNNACLKPIQESRKTNPNSKSPIRANIELDNADPLSNMVQLYEEILLVYKSTIIPRE